ncbi:hypothetical protein [Alloacidobacterium sp.]|uniref:endonuclease III domain-containing protein n=1 Tax=Alloacidobacterium sp. TaxID=2951999 RepID=UPI002D6816D4|nr:hypothetical protein [Alloacidobacterium sp.]HYK37591.1 hypothetical protein [Alloacidobacterium sp.]
MPRSAVKPSKPSAQLTKILSLLEKRYGRLRAPYPTDPYEMLLHRNCGYPQSDERCDKGFRALKEKIGLAPDSILAAPDDRLRETMRSSVMKPALSAFRLKEIAARVLDEFAGDMSAVLKRPMPEAKKLLKKFPTVGDSTADKILLFTKTAPVAAIPSNCVHVPLRLGFGREAKNWAASYRSAQTDLDAQLPSTCSARLRAYLLLKQHGQELCKLSHPLCSQCPLAALCPFYLGSHNL